MRITGVTVQDLKAVSVRFAAEYLAAVMNSRACGLRIRSGCVTGTWWFIPIILRGLDFPKSSYVLFHRALTAPPGRSSTFQSRVRGCGMAPLNLTGMNHWHATPVP